MRKMIFVKVLLISLLSFSINAYALEADEYGNSLGAKILGDSTMQIAVQGESFIDFKIDAPKNNTFKFQPIENIVGITLSPEGRLISTSDAKEQTITITAKDAAGVVLTHEVKLYKSWRVSDNVDLQNRFTTAAQITKSNLSFIKYFSGINLIIIRSVVGAAAVILFISYTLIKIKARKKYKKV